MFRYLSILLAGLFAGTAQAGEIEILVPGADATAGPIVRSQDSMILRDRGSGRVIAVIDPLAAAGDGVIISDPFGRTIVIIDGDGRPDIILGDGRPDPGLAARRAAHDARRKREDR